jgi:hypothetical protein
VLLPLRVQVRALLLPEQEQVLLLLRVRAQLLPLREQVLLLPLRVRALPGQEPGLRAWALPLRERVLYGNRPPSL